MQSRSQEEPGEDTDPTQTGPEAEGRLLRPLWRAVLVLCVAVTGSRRLGILHRGGLLFLQCSSQAGG